MDLVSQIEIHKELKRRFMLLTFVFAFHDDFLLGFRSNVYLNHIVVMKQISVKLKLLIRMHYA